MWSVARRSSFFASSLLQDVNVGQLVRRSWSSAESRHYDIVIAGGGMVGCTLACALAKDRALSAQKILLLESAPKMEFSLKESYSNRVSAINSHTKNLMESIGAWRHIEQMRVRPVKNMQVWDACSDAMITFSHENLQSNVAYIVENDVLLHAVNKELESPDNYNQIEIIHNSRITDYELPGLRQYSKIKMSDGSSYSCKLLIGADGANSKVRQTMNVKYMSWLYNQLGIVATLELNQTIDNSTAWQRFLPTGPIAVLPLNSTHSSLVWSVNSKEAQKLLKLSGQEFVDALNHALHSEYPRNKIVDCAVNTLSNILSTAFLPSGISRQLPPSIKSVNVESRAAFPLGFGHSVNYVDQGVVLVGDAAHRVHPLAGQGVNLGFGDISSLVSILSDAIYRGSFIGDKSHLQNYETERQRHVVPTSVIIDGLQKLYGTDIAPVVFMRSLGLQFVHAVSPIKKLIMNHAMA